MQYIFDISRDVLINDDLSMTKPVCERNGNKMAQLKITVGTSEGNDAWKSNLSFATMLASKNSSLVSSVVLSSFSLSQHLCPVSLKIDVGAFSNSFDEAALLANELSICLADLISE